VNHIEQYIKKINQDGIKMPIRWHLFLGHSDGSISANQSTSLHHISKMKDKNHMIISIDAEKAFDKI